MAHYNSPLTNGAPNRKPYGLAASSACVLLGVLTTSCFNAIKLPEPLPTTSKSLQSDDNQPGGQLSFTTFHVANVFPGECADDQGVPNGRNCLDQPHQLDTTAKALPGGTFRFYSQLKSIDVSGAGSAGASASGNVNVVNSEHLFVMEWARYNNQAINIPATVTTPAVSSVDVGIAIRVLFKVNLRSSSATAAAHFGIGDISTKLALGDASVEAQYNTVGPVQDILPSANVFSIKTVDDFVKAQNTFYDAIVTVSRAWDDLQKGNTPSSSPTPATQTTLAEVKTPAQFILGPVGYVVTNVPQASDVGRDVSFSGGYLTGISATISGYSCKHAYDKLLPAEARKDNQFVSGFLKSIRDIYGQATSECNDSSPSHAQQGAAEDAWKKYVLPRLVQGGRIGE